jgi:hypothetical protein
VEVASQKNVFRPHLQYGIAWELLMAEYIITIRAVPSNDRKTVAQDHGDVVIDVTPAHWNLPTITSLSG